MRLFRADQVSIGSTTLHTSPSGRQSNAISPKRDLASEYGGLAKFYARKVGE